MQSSSWVGDVDYDPNANLVTVAIGKLGKSKTKYATPRDAAAYVNAPSIGKHVNKEMFNR